MNGRAVAFSFQVAVFILNALLLLRNVRRWSGERATYSQVRDDHPEYLIHPLRVPKVAVPLDYNAKLPYAFDANATPYRWQSRFDDPRDWLILEPHMHAYRTVMAHQLHCVQIIHDAIVAGDPSSFFGHVQHCLSYLRQMILCDADLTLEDPRALNPEDVSGNTTRICRDWNAVWAESDRRVQKWRKISRSSLSP